MKFDIIATIDTGSADRGFLKIDGFKEKGANTRVGRYTARTSSLDNKLAVQFISGRVFAKC